MPVTGNLEEVILSSVLQAEGQIMPKFIQRFLKMSDEAEICQAILGASVGGAIPKLEDLAGILIRGETVVRLSNLMIAPGLPLALAESEAEKLVRQAQAAQKSARLAELAQQAIELPMTGPAIAQELKSLMEAAPETTDSEMKGLFREALVRYEDLHASQGKTGIMTGFSQFDILSGGLKPGQMTVVAAETNGGKSTFALNIVNHAITQGHGVLLVTLEMDRHEIIDLLVAMNCEVNRNGFNTGKFTESEMQKMLVHSKRISNYPLFIDDRAGPTAQDIAEKIRSLSGRIGLVVVDYIQLVSPLDAKESREQQVSGITRTLRKAAKETRLPIIVLSQLNDEGKLRESRVVGHEAHNVIMLGLDGSQIEVKVVKGRSIPKMKFKLDYAPEFCRLSNERMGNYND